MDVCRNQIKCVKDVHQMLRPLGHLIGENMDPLILERLHEGLEVLLQAAERQQFPVGLLINWFELYLKVQTLVCPKNRTHRHKFEALLPTELNNLLKWFQRNPIFVGTYQLFEMIEILLANVTPECVLELIQNKHIILNLWKIIHHLGDFNTQSVVFRVMTMLLKCCGNRLRREHLSLIPCNKENPLRRHLDMAIQTASDHESNFEMASRNILNALNKDSSKFVYSFQCDDFKLGDWTFNKSIRAREFWIDLNYDPKTLTFKGCCQLMCNTIIDVSLQITEIILERDQMTVYFRSPASMPRPLCDLEQLKIMNCATLKLPELELQRLRQRADMISYFNGENDSFLTNLRQNARDNGTNASSSSNSSSATGNLSQNVVNICDATTSHLANGTTIGATENIRERAVQPLVPIIPGNNDRRVTRKRTTIPNYHDDSEEFELQPVEKPKRKNISSGRPAQTKSVPTTTSIPSNRNSPVVVFNDRPSPEIALLRAPITNQHPSSITPNVSHYQIVAYPSATNDSNKENQGKSCATNTRNIKKPLTDPRNRTLPLREINQRIFENDNDGIVEVARGANLYERQEAVIASPQIVNVSLIANPSNIVREAALANSTMVSSYVNAELPSFRFGNTASYGNSAAREIRNSGSFGTGSDIETLDDLVVADINELIDNTTNASARMTGFRNTTTRGQIIPIPSNAQQTQMLQMPAYETTEAYMQRIRQCLERFQNQVPKDTIRAYEKQVEAACYRILEEYKRQKTESDQQIKFLVAIEQQLMKVCESQQTSSQLFSRFNNDMNKHLEFLSTHKVSAVTAQHFEDLRKEVQNLCAGLE